MHLTPARFDDATLASFGTHAARLLVQREFAELTKQYGYAIALGRSPAFAVEADLANALSDLQVSHNALATPLSIKVKHFPENSIGLVASVFCELLACERGQVLLELVVTTVSSGFSVTLEQVSAIAGPAQPNAA